MKSSLLVNIIAYFFILLFLYTGIEKLMEIRSFHDQMLASPILGPIAWLVTWALPLIELLLAIVLFVPAWQRKGLYASVALMALFTIYLIGILLIDNHLTCSCGGIIENLSPRQHLFFNLAAIGLAIAAILAGRKQQNRPAIRWGLTSGTLLLLLVLGWIGVVAAKAPAKIKTGFEGRLLPEFNLLMSDSLTLFNTRDIPLGKPFIMIGFSPYCPHCQTEMAEIIRHIRQFGDTTIYFVTPYSYSDMKRFYSSFHLEKYPTIIVGVDKNDSFLRYFNASAIPYTTIFDARKRLKEVIPGEASSALLAQGLSD